MNKRALRLEKYGISKYRYGELKNFCLQYPEWIDELNYKKDTLKSKNIDGMPIPQNIGISDQTGHLAIRRAELREKCDLIEQTALQASSDLYQYIIKSVCYDEPMWYLRDILGMGCESNAFYDARRYFFYLLDKKKIV